MLIFSLLLNMQSHPTWVRGLKPSSAWTPLKGFASHPTWVRGLKLLVCFYLAMCERSHPTWVRGLKQLVGNIRCRLGSRTLRGCVD